MKKPEIHHPHDSLFKKTFKDKAIAMDFLKSRLPAEILADIDLNTLSVEDSTYITDDLKSSYSDLVLSAKIKGETGYIYTLVELQTTNDGKMPLRVQKYDIQIAEDHIDMGRGTKLPTIINLVIYAGKEAYKGEKRLIDAYEDPKAYLESLSRTFLIDLTQQSRDQILQDGKAGVIQLVIKQGRLRDFRNLLKDDSIVTLISKSPYRISIFRYILNRDERPSKQVLDEVLNLDAKLKQKIMSGLQRELQQREQKGIQIGEQEGIQKGRQSTLKELVKKGYIGKSLADKILKEKPKS